MSQSYHLFVKRLKELKDRANIDQTAIVKKIKETEPQFTQGYLSLILGHKRRPSAVTIERLAEAILQGEPETSITEEKKRLLILAGYVPNDHSHPVPFRVEKVIVAPDDGKKRKTLEDPEQEQEVPFPDFIVLGRSKTHALLAKGKGWKSEAKHWGIEDGAVLIVREMDSDGDIDDTGLIILGKEVDSQIQVEVLRCKRKKKECEFFEADGSRTNIEPEEFSLIGQIIHVIPPVLKKLPLFSKRRPRMRADLTVGIGPFQDALLPVVGDALGWYQEENLRVAFRNTDWHDWHSFFEHADTDRYIIFTNTFSYVANHTKNSNRVFWYGVNLFDRGFSLLAKDPSLQNMNEIARESTPSLNQKDNVKKVLEQLEDEPIITILKSDWAAQIYSLAKAYNVALIAKPPVGKELTILEGETDVPKIYIQDVGIRIGLMLNEADIDKSGNFFIGSLPQRIALLEGKRIKKKWKELLSPKDLPGPYPVNGFVVDRRFADTSEGQDILLTFLKVWFRITNMVTAVKGREEAATILERAFAQFDRVTSLNAIKILEAWKCEQFPRNPLEIEKIIPRSVWEADWNRSCEYLSKLWPEPRDFQPPLSKEWCWNESTHDKYIQRYGYGRLRGDWW